MDTGLSDYIRIRQAINDQDYLEAIELSKTLSSESFFLATFQRVNRGKIKDAFWDTLFLKEANHLFQSDLIHGILGKFWSSDWSLNQVRSFSENYPKVFCQSIRLSGKFLEDDFLEMIQPVAARTPYMEAHFSKMQELKSKQQTLTESLDQIQQDLASIELEELLVELIVWWEHSRSQNMAHMQKLHTVYHRVLKAFFILKPDAVATIESAYYKFEAILRQYERSDKLKIKDLLDSFMNLYQFETTELENYCYEVKHDFDKNGQYIHDNRALTKYQNDGKKLGVFQTYWRYLATLITEDQIDKGKIELNPKNDLDLHNYISRFQAELLLGYVNRASELDQITSGIFTNLEAHSLSRYRLVMEGMISQGKNIVDALSEIRTMNNDHGFPIHIFSYQGFKNKTSGSFKGKIPSHQIDEAVDRVISTPDDFDMLKRPIIKLKNNHVLNLMNLTSESNVLLKSYFNMINNTIEKEDRQGDKGFEQVICEAFIEANFKAQHGIEYLQNTQNGSAGDVDVIAKEADFALLLEVKRIKLRYDSEGIWNEREMKTNWASLQLHKAHLALEAETPELVAVLPKEITHKVSLIVNPWFEYDHELVGNYLKVSWFEILYALTEMKNEWQKAPNKLKALTDLIIEDKVWPNIFIKANAYEDILKSMSNDH